MPSRCDVSSPALVGAVSCGQAKLHVVLIIHLVGICLHGFMYAFCLLFGLKGFLTASIFSNDNASSAGDGEYLSIPQRRRIALESKDVEQFLVGHSKVSLPAFGLVHEPLFTVIVQNRPRCQCMSTFFVSLHLTPPSLCTLPCRYPAPSRCSSCCRFVARSLGYSALGFVLYFQDRVYAVLQV